MKQNPDFWARTHQGLTRDKNEDAFLWLGEAGTNEQGYLWCVCDGMGGEAAGELASSVVAERVAAVYPHALTTSKSPHLALEEAFQAANRRLLYMQETNPDLAKMGSTVAAVAYYEGQLWFASVGDSRIYTWRQSRLTQRTVDHTKYEKMMELGVLTAADARPDHPAHHVLLNVLGRAAMTVDTLDGLRIPPDETCVLICSDGLSSFVDEQTIDAAFLHLDARDATRLLLSAALPNSNDNVTLDVIRFAPPASPLPIKEVAAKLGVVLIDEDGAPLQTSSSHFGSSTRWQDHQTGGRVAVAASQVDAAPAKSKKQKQTVLFSPAEVKAKLPDAREAAAGSKGTILFAGNIDDLKEEAASLSAPASAPLGSTSPESTVSASSPTTSPGRGRPAMKGVGASREVSGPERGERSASSKATSEKSGHEKAASSNAANGRTTKKKPRVRRRPTPGLFLSRKDRKNASSSPSDSSATPLRWVLGGALLLFVVAGLWMWRIATDEPPVVVVDETAAVEGETGEQRPELEDFKFAESPRLPDRVHPVDLMPGYLVGSGQLWMDAHEVTVGQFSKVASSSFALQGLVEQVDEPRFAGLPCATGLHDDASRTHEPVCASPQTAAVYCETVGRRLPLEEDWRAVLASDKPLIAVGYGRVFERASDGAPPAIAQPISGLLGVHGGLPELLEPNAAQRRFKDLVLWVGGEAEEVRVVRGADVAGTSSTMFGFRCVERVMIEDMMPAQGIADSELPPPASGQPAASRAQRSEGRTGSAPAGGRASGSVEPRVNPPNEAPIDPNVSDDSLILQRLRQHGAGKTP